eukprot:gene6803-7908_t
MFQLRDKGVISLDDPVSKYYPEFSIRDLYHTNGGGGGHREISLKELSSHQSGLPRDIPCAFDQLPTKHCTERLILDRLAKQFLTLPQYYSTSHYSNLGIALLGHILERAANTSYETYVEEKILKPLQMNNSSFNYQHVKDRMAIGISYLRNGTIVPQNIIGLGWGTPMGGLYSTGRDMARFASFWLTQHNDILDISTVKECLSTVFNLNSDGVSAYGQPWELSYNSKNRIWTRQKSGSLNGYRSQLALVPELGLGVFISAMKHFQTPDCFMGDILDLLIPAYVSVLSIVNANPEIMRPISSRMANNRPPNTQSLDIFTGTYAYHASQFRVCNDNGILTGSLGDDVIYNLTLFAEDYPHVLRMTLADPESQTCKSVDVLGRTMLLVSRDPYH